MIDFDKIWYGDAHWPLTADLSLNLEFLKIQNGGGRHLEKSQNSRHLRNGLTDLYEIWYADAKCVP